MKISLLGYYGFGNLGDELLLRACIDMLARCGLEREKIIVLSNNPEETSRNFQVHAVNRWKFRDVVKAFRESSALLLGGGGIFQDTTSLKSCVWYWGILRLAKFFGCKVFALGQSVGPLKSRASKFFAGDALRLCEILHVRDENSFTTAKNLGCKKISLGCDLVMTLTPEKLSREKNITLLNLRPSKNLARYVKIISPHLKEKNILGVALSQEDEEALKIFDCEILRVKNFHDAQEIFSRASSCVGMRLHFGVLARIFGVPLSLLPYDVKVSEFAKQSGVPAIIDEWQEPAAPLPVPDSARDVDKLCGEILSAL